MKVEIKCCRCGAYLGYADEDTDVNYYCDSCGDNE